ncbi:MAG TPA: hypothetical protein VIQ31_18650 [Phormidium sp.]
MHHKLVGLSTLLPIEPQQILKQVSGIFSNGQAILGRNAAFISALISVV